MSGRRVGAYGGTFDPPHNGHLDVARAVAARFELDELLLIPARRPPHKDAGAISDAYHRYAMTALATLSEPRLRASTVEIEAPERPYTFETMGRLREWYGPEAELYFVMGADSFEELNTWREPARLLEVTNLVVAARPGHRLDAAHLPGAFRGNVVDLREAGDRSVAAALAARGLQRQAACYIYLTGYVSRDISSTDIRRQARDGEGIRELVPPGVADYVEKYQLYRR